MPSIEDNKTEIKSIDPFQEIDEIMLWSELGSLPEKVYNPLDNLVSDENLSHIDQMVRHLCNPEYLHFACRMLLNVELLPFQCVILDTLWHNKIPILIGSRGCSKSFCLAVYCLLRMVFHPGCKIVIVGNGLRQARQVFDYMSAIWDKAPVLRDIAGRGKTVGPRREVDRFQFEIGDSKCYAIPLGMGDKIRGMRANYLIADEFGSISEEIFNVSVIGFASVSANPTEKAKQAALVKKLKELGQWNEKMESLSKEGPMGNQIVYSGTAFYSFNHFYKQFKTSHAIISSKGDPKKLKELIGDDVMLMKGLRWTDYAIIRIPYTALPEDFLDQGILAQAKAKLSQGQFNMEYGAIFVTDSDGFYKRSILESATVNKPVLINGQLIQFTAYKQGEPDKSYVIGVDPAAESDNAAIVVLEQNLDHRKVVHCWTTNRKKYNALKKRLATEGTELEDDYYRYIAKKIRELMRVFATEHIIMDKNGGGIAIAESLASKDTCAGGEYPVFEIIDPDKPKPNDGREGLHMLELLVPTSDINSDANHGMLKDFQDKILLFPLYDTIEVAKSIEMDHLAGETIDTFENLLGEIEELKNEITSIIVTPSSSLGKETFDTPNNSQEGTKRMRSRKDRFSALLYANFYCRNKEKSKIFEVQYKTVGKRKDMVTSITKPKGGGPAYYGLGTAQFGNSNRWLNGSCIGKAIKHR